MSKQERMSWLSLAITIVVGGWYFSAVLASPQRIDLHSASIGALVTTLIGVSIVLGIAGELVLRWIAGSGDADRVPEDERDRIIGAKAYRNAYGVLWAAVLMVVGFIVAADTEGVHGWWGTAANPLFGSFEDSVFIAHLLMLSGLLASCAVYASRIVYYRRGS